MPTRNTSTMPTKIKNKQLLLKRHLSEFLATEEIPFKEHHFSLVENFEIFLFGIFSFVGILRFRKKTKFFGCNC